MVYRVLVAAVPVLIAYGVLDEATACHVLTIDMTASRNGWAVGRLAW